VSELVVQAFRAIGPPGPRYRREVALVAKALRDSGDQEALALFGAGPDPEPDPAFNHEALAAVQEVAERAGSDAWWRWTCTSRWSIPVGPLFRTLSSTRTEGGYDPVSPTPKTARK
jgi:hypothetical protein